jgi:uncharacterized membrane protein
MMLKNKDEKALITEENAKDYFAERRRNSTTMMRICEVIEVEPPPKGTQEEAIVLALVDQFLDFAHRTAESKLEAMMLPELYEAERAANVPREARTREKWGNRARSFFGGIAAFIWGAILGIFEATLEWFIQAIERTAVVLVPGLLAFVMACVYYTYQRPPETINGGYIGGIVIMGLWWGVLASLLSGIIYGLSRAARRHSEIQAAERKRKRQVPDTEESGPVVVVKRPGEEVGV